MQNRLPTKALENFTPYGIWYEWKPSLNFLRAFGCVCLVYVPQVKRDKLDNKAIFGILMGYNTNFKGYKVCLSLQIKEDDGF